MAMLEEQKMKIISLRTAGLKQHEIAAETGLSLSAIKSFLSRNKVSKSTKYCKRCGAPLQMVKGKKEKLFCSNRCRLLFHLHSHVPASKICPTCGKEFSNIYNPKQVYCCRACYLKNRYGGRLDEQ